MNMMEILFASTNKEVREMPNRDRNCCASIVGSAAAAKPSSNYHDMVHASKFSSSFCTHVTQLVKRERIKSRFW